MIWRLYLAYAVLVQHFGGPRVYTRHFGYPQGRSMAFFTSRGVDASTVMIRGTNLFRYKTRSGELRTWPDPYTALRGFFYITRARAVVEYLDMNA